jgi:hypothetical protein
MARKGRFGEQAPTDYAGNVLKSINQMSATGDTAAAPGTTDGTVRSSGPSAEIKAKRARAAAPLTAEQIAADPHLSMLKNALSTMTYEQALANYRALTKVNSMIPLAKANESAKYKAKATQMVRRSAAAMAKLTPEQRAAEQIFFAMGGSLEANNPKYGGYGSGINTALYSKLGLEAPTTAYAPVKFDVNNIGNTVAFKLNNPLNATQKSRLQKLRGLTKSGATLTAKQNAALNRLKAKKNAPTILP